MTISQNFNDTTFHKATKRFKEMFHDFIILMIKDSFKDTNNRQNVVH